MTRALALSAIFLLTATAIQEDPAPQVQPVRLEVLQ